MRSDKLRVATAAAALAVVAVGLVAGINIGTYSGFGWEDLAVLCPVGALLTMVASRTLVPRAVLSLLLVAAVVLLVGRAFCGWLCPVPLLDRLRDFFRTPAKRRALAEERRREVTAVAEGALAGPEGAAEAAGGEDRAADGEGECRVADGALAASVAVEDADERAGSEGAAEGAAPSRGGCASCGACGGARPKLDSRHYVLGGALLSTAVFGFPVFCLVCPVGLTFAMVLLLWRLFFAGDMTIAVVLVPLLLVVELVLLRKWCSRICPISGLMNLAGRASRTFKPVIDESRCLETTTGTACSRCAEACSFDINLRHPEAGELTLADCTRCRACVDACPTQAVSMPFLARNGTVSLADAPRGAKAASAATLGDELTEEPAAE